MHLIKHRVFGDLESGAGAGHDLGDGESYGLCLETLLSLLSNRTTQASRNHGQLQLY